MAASELVPGASVAHQIQSLMFGQQHDFNNDLSGPRRSEKWEDGENINQVERRSEDSRCGFTYNNLNSITHIYFLALHTTRNLRLLVDRKIG